MSKQALSVTLDAENVTWLRGRAGGGDFRSVSDLLNRLVSDARTTGGTARVRSVAGTIDIAPSDPALLKADAAVRALNDRSLARPLIARERSPEYRVRPKNKRG